MPRHRAAAPPPAAAVPIPDDLPRRPFRRLTEGPVTLNPGGGQDGFPFVDMYDSALAAPEVHHVRYMNEHVRFIEVAYFPGVRGRMHGHAYSSVFAIDAPVPKSVNLALDPERPNLMGRGAGPKGQEFPRCQTMGPQAPHAETNLDTWPHHFYRLEFLRVDGAGRATLARVVSVAAPRLPIRGRATPGAPLTPAWRYSRDYDSFLAAPNTIACCTKTIMCDWSRSASARAKPRPCTAIPFHRCWLSTRPPPAACAPSGPGHCADRTAPRAHRRRD